MRRANIMIVEDDRVVARDIRQQLERMGHAVVATTADGEQAAALAAQARAELVLLDIRLGGRVDGIEAAQRIRALCEIPVIFLTAYADDETIRRASHTEPFGYLLKPFEDTQLRTTVEMALYKHAAEQRLRDSERRYAAMLASIGDAVIAVDAALCVSFMNPRAEALTGWTRGEAAGAALDALFHLVDEDTGEPVEGSAWRLLREPGAGNQTRQALLRDRQGRECPIEDSSSPILDEGGRLTGAVLVFRDLSERRGIERALRAAEAEVARVAQLTRMSELAAAIAHEINQPLAAIVTSAGAGLNWLRREPPDLGETRDILGRIQSDGSRAADVIRSLQALSRRAGPSFSSFDLCEVLREVLGLSRDAMQRAGVRLRLEGVGPPRAVHADRVQIQQVLHNLVTNALDAMDGVAPDARRLTLSLQGGAEGRVRVTVSDTGVGLPPGDARRLLDPFVTTKPHGMGMGLSICRSILEAHDSRLAMAPAAPRGASFSFELPFGDNA
jgi:PAS domain S-box-containing protein